MSLDFSVLAGKMQYFYTGVKLTILISILSVLFGVIFGALLTLMKRSKFKIGKVKALYILLKIYLHVKIRVNS